MEKTFAQQEIDKVMQANAEKEAKAYAESRQGGLSDSLSFHLAVASMVGLKRFSDLIKTAQEAGLLDVLKAYSEFSIMKGFKDGYKAGCLSMLEEK